MLCKYCDDIKQLRDRNEVIVSLPNKALLIESAKSCPTCWVVWEYGIPTIEVRETRKNLPLPLDRVATRWILPRGQAIMGFVSNGFPNSWTHLSSLPLATASGAQVSDAEQWLLTGIFRDRTSPRCIQIAQDWISDCEKNHPKCNQRISADPLLPSRVLDLALVKSDQLVKLVEVAAREGARGRYIALSYCWGSSGSLKTTTKNLGQHKAGIPLSAFPQSLRDAVMTTVALGFRYLWIDSLCIIQDSWSDWDAQSQKMEAIYGTSTVTISATASSSASVGWLASSSADNAPVKLWDEELGDSVEHNGDATTGVYLIRPIKSWDYNIEDSPVSTRGWTLQERLLPTRIVHFGQQQMAFECLSGTTTEAAVHLQKDETLDSDEIDSIFQPETGLQISRTYMEEYGSILLHLKGLLHDGDGGDSDGCLPLRGYIDEPVSLEERILQRWYTIMRVYSRRRLTVATDKLPALLGILRLFDAKLRSHSLKGDDLWKRFPAGIWANDLQRGLCWLAADAAGTTRTQPPRAPSWSWMCLDGFTLFPDELLHDESRHCAVESVEASVDKFYTCTGILHLRTRVDRFSSLEQLDQWAEEHNFKIFWDTKSDQEASSTGVTVAFVAKLWHEVVDDMNKVPNYSVYWMVLRPVSEGASAPYRRVGMTKNKNPWNGSVAKGQSEQIVMY